MSKTINRIMQFIDTLGISVRQFDISIEAANGYTLRMEKNNASVGSDVIERISRTYPQLNLVWLITGKGSMFINEQSANPKAMNMDVELLVQQKLQEKWSAEKQELLDEIIKEINDQSQDN